MADDDVDAQFRRLVAEVEAERAATVPTKPTRASLREVKREARARRRGSRRRAPRGERLRTVVVLSATLAVVGGVAYVQLHGGSSLLPGSAAAGQGPAPAASTSPDPASDPGFPTPGHEESAHPLGTPPDVADAPGEYRFMYLQKDGVSPAAYDPCRPIHYVVNPVGEPPQAATLLSQAISSVSAATGLRFVPDGTTTERNSRDRPYYLPERYGDRWAPVLVTWPSGAQQPDFVGSTIGEAGSGYVLSDTGQKVFVTGVAEFDSDWFRSTLGQPGGAVRAEAVLLHELGHLVGLDHVTDRSQIMFAMETPLTRDYGRGDLAGLAKLGSGTCQPNL